MHAKEKQKQFDLGQFVLQTERYKFQVCIDRGDCMCQSPPYF